FFEMLGNFSFGDYFKRDAIAYAWELVTSPDWYGIAKDKLYVTVFGGAQVAPGNTLGADEEARGFWLAQNVPAARIVPIPGLKDNFWAMGDTGPCGPCSEIHYDMGPEASEQGHTDCRFPCDCGRYVEIWNLVFMQFNRDSSGTLTPLPKPCVDTGMGLERTAAVLEGVISNYDTDLFTPLLKRAAELCDVDEKKEEALEEGRGGAASLRVIADHARAMTFLIADGVQPSNEGRGYVLRKIMRRAIYHGRLLGATKPFLAEMVNVVRAEMGIAYPELRDPAAARIAEIVLAEEQRFAHTLDKGLKEWDASRQRQRRRFVDEQLRSMLPKGEQIDKVVEEALTSNDPRQLIELVREKSGDEKARMFSTGWDTLGILSMDGHEAFRLYDTFGLPVDFMIDLARDGGFQFDQKWFDVAMEE